MGEKKHFPQKSFIMDKCCKITNGYLQGKYGHYIHVLMFFFIWSSQLVEIKEWVTLDIKYNTIFTACKVNNY